MGVSHFAEQARRTCTISPSSASLRVVDIVHSSFLVEENEVRKDNSSLLRSDHFVIFTPRV